MIKFNDLEKILSVGYECNDINNKRLINLNFDRAMNLLIRINPNVLEIDYCYDNVYYENDIPNVLLTLDLDKTDYGNMFGE